ncbi:unnamed protein product [Prorocentrum cordatum]|uniref:RNA-directed RNA polymerase n=2 Tax=Prorocentrum cordatum TaxID=2364126 RepID=A0ABN9WT49_9DINO|nr:unnamed protein product [Polarella glacialis]
MQAWQSLPLGKMLGRQFLRQLLECTFLLQMLACRFLQQMLECKFLGVLQQILRCKFLQQTWEFKFLQQMLACMFLQQMLEVSSAEQSVDMHASSAEVEMHVFGSASTGVGMQVSSADVGLQVSSAEQDVGMHVSSADVGMHVSGRASTDVGMQVSSAYVGLQVSLAEQDAEVGMRVSSAGSATTCARVNQSDVRVPDKMEQFDQFVIEVGVHGRSYLIDDMLRMSFTSQNVFRLARCLGRKFGPPVASKTQCRYSLNHDILFGVFYMCTRLKISEIHGFTRQRATRDAVVEGILQDLIVVQGGPRTLGEHVHASFWKEDFSQWTLQDTRRVLGLNLLCIPCVSSSKMDVQEKEVMEEDEDDLQHNQAPDAMVGVETAVELVPTNLRIRKYCFERPIVTDRHAIASAWQQWQRGLDPEALCSSAPDSKRLIYTDPPHIPRVEYASTSSGQWLLPCGYLVL